MFALLGHSYLEELWSHQWPLTLWPTFFKQSRETGAERRNFSTQAYSQLHLVVLLMHTHYLSKLPRTCCWHGIVWSAAPYCNGALLLLGGEALL